MVGVTDPPHRDGWSTPLTQSEIKYFCVQNLKMRHPGAAERDRTRGPADKAKKKVPKNRRKKVKSKRAALPKKGKKSAPPPKRH
jgi:hypothetical protein